MNLTKNKISLYTIYLKTLSYFRPNQCKIKTSYKGIIDYINNSSYTEKYISKKTLFSLNILKK